MLRRHAAKIPKKGKDSSLDEVGKVGNTPIHTSERPAQEEGSILFQKNVLKWSTG